MILKVIKSAKCKCCDDWERTLVKLSNRFNNLQVEFYQLEERDKLSDYDAELQKMKGVPFTLICDNNGDVYGSIQGAAVYAYAVEQLNKYNEII